MQQDQVILARIKNLFPGAVYVSAVTGTGMDELLSRISSFVSNRIRLLHLKLPPSRHDLAALIHANGNILESEYDDEGNLRLTINIPQAFEKKLAAYIIDRNP
jgi:GTP-binding protein HflX